MNNYISISQLNDFIFCPYSIYLHNVYMEADEDVFKAPPQKIGKLAHNSIDSKKVDNIMIKIEEFSKNFTMDDSIVVFDIDASKIRKYGNAIHRDEAIVYF